MRGRVVFRIESILANLHTPHIQWRDCWSLFRPRIDIKGWICIKMMDPLPSPSHFPLMPRKMARQRITPIWGVSVLQTKALIRADAPTERVASRECVQAILTRLRNFFLQQMCGVTPDARPGEFSTSFHAISFHLCVRSCLGDGGNGGGRSKVVR